MQMNGAIVRLSEDDLAWIRAQVERGDAAPARLEAWFSPENTESYVFDKAFAAVHFLLTGSCEAGAGALSFLGNTAFGLPVALGHTEPTRVIGPVAVAGIADAIEGLLAPDIVARLNSADLETVEPFIGVAIEDDHKEWLLAVLQGLMTFMRFAANDGVPLLVAALPTEAALLPN